MTGGIIEITIPYELWDNTNPDSIQLPKGTYKALIENPSKVLYIHVVGNPEGIKYNLNTLEAIRTLETNENSIDIIINFKKIANEFYITSDDTINWI